MGVNKVNFGGKTLIDLTGDTLESAEQLLKGIIAHAKDGSQIEGMLEAGGGGGAKYTFGTFTLSSDTKTKGYVIDHGLGLVPQIFILFPKYVANEDYAFHGCAIWSEGIRKVGYAESKYAYLYGNKGVGMYIRASLGINFSLTVDENSITLPEFSLAAMVNGIIHSWIAIGGISV